MQPGLTELTDFSFFYIRTMHLDIIKVLFIRQLMHQWVVLKTILKFTLKFTLKQLRHESYVYWTVHHFDSWIKRDQLDVTCFIISLFNGQHISDVNTSILRSLRLICWVISWGVLLWFDVCWCYVVVWLGWCGIRILHHPNQTTT